MLLLTLFAFAFLWTCILGLDVMMTMFSLLLPIICLIGGGFMSIYMASHIFHSKFEPDKHKYSSEPSSKRCMISLFAFINFVIFLAICGLIGSYFGIKIGLVLWNF